MNVTDRFDHYERRFSRAMADIPRRTPTAPSDRDDIVRIVRASLGVRDGVECDALRVFAQSEAFLNGGAS